MLSRQVIKGLSQSLIKLTVLKTCAYHWDFTAQHLSPKLNFNQLLLYVISTIYEVFFAVPYFIAQRRIIMEHSQDISQIIIPSLCYMGMTILVTIQVTYLITGYHYETFVNKLFQSENILGKFLHDVFLFTETSHTNLLKFVSISILLRTNLFRE